MSTSRWKSELSEIPAFSLADLASEIEAMTGQIADAETLGRLRWIPAEEAQP